MSATVYGARMTEDQQVTKRNGAKAKTRSRARSVIKGPRARRATADSTTAKPGRFTAGTNSQTGVPFRRGPDRVPRGTIKSIFQLLLNDDGTLGEALEAETGVRADIARLYYNAVRAGSMPGADAATVRVAMAAVNDIADRLEGKPVAKIETPVYPQAIFYRAGDPPPRRTPAEPEEAMSRPPDEVEL